MENNNSIGEARAAIEKEMVCRSPWQNKLQKKRDSIPAGVPVEFWHLIEESDQVIGAASTVCPDEGINVLENAHLTPEERDFIELEALGEQLFGEEIRLDRSIVLSGSKASDISDLEELVRSTIRAVVLGAHRGDAEALAFLNKGVVSPSVTDESSRKFAGKLSQLAEEFDTGSITSVFLSGLANSDQAAMRRAVREIVRSNPR